MHLRPTSSGLYLKSLSFWTCFSSDSVGWGNVSPVTSDRLPNSYGSIEIHFNSFNSVQFGFRIVVQLWVSCPMKSMLNLYEGFGVDQQINICVVRKINLLGWFDYL